MFNSDNFAIVLRTKPLIEVWYDKVFKGTVVNQTDKRTNYKELLLTLSLGSICISPTFPFIWSFKPKIINISTRLKILYSGNKYYIPPGKLYFAGI